MFFLRYPHVVAWVLWIVARALGCSERFLKCCYMVDKVFLWVVGCF